MGIDKDDSLDSVPSPLFELFLNCVWQMICYEPSAFEYNNQYVYVVCIVTLGC